MKRANPTIASISLAMPCLVAGFGLSEVHTQLTPFLHTLPPLPPIQPQTPTDLTHSLSPESISNLLTTTLATTATASTLTPASLTPWSLFQSYQTTLATHPLPTKMLTGATLATAGDAIAQSREDDPYNPSRGASFAAFDMVYRAAQHWLFPIIVEYCRGQYFYSMLAAVGASQLADFVDVSALAAMERSLASQLIIVPFMYYPVFFTFTAAMQGLNFEEGVQRAKENFLPLMKRNLLFWIPVQYVQFCYVPTDLQIPFLSCAGLAWTFILSLLAGSAKKYAVETPDHETYCVTGTEVGCVIPEEEVFPVPEVIEELEEMFEASVGMGEERELLEESGENQTVMEEERELVTK